MSNDQYLNFINIFEIHTFIIFTLNLRMYCFYHLIINILIQFNYFFSSFDGINPLARAVLLLYFDGFSGGLGINPACPKSCPTMSEGCAPTESQYLTKKLSKT